MTRPIALALALLLLLGPTLALAQSGFPPVHSTVPGANGDLLTNSAGGVGATSTVTPAQLTQTVNIQNGTTYTVVTGDRGKLVTHSNASPVAVTLPQAGGSFPAGWFYDVQNRGAGTVTVTPTTSGIDGVASLALITNQGVRIVSDGTNYYTQRGVGSATSGITSLGGLAGPSQTFGNDTNVTVTSTGTTHQVGWAGVLATSRGGTGFNDLTLSGNTHKVVTTTGSLTANDCVKIDASGNFVAAGAGCSTAPQWSTLTNPSANLSLSMGANTSTLTYGSATGSNDMFKLTDGVGNTGTGNLFRSTTTSTSLAAPFQADVNGAGVQVTNTGDLVAIGGGDIDATIASAKFAFTGTVSPPQITADQNDYNPTNLALANVLRLNSDATRTITGLVPGSAPGGRILHVVNVGAQNIVLSNQSASSTAANRFLLGSSVTLAGDQSLTLVYDSTTSRWRPHTTPSSGAGAGTVTTFSTTVPTQGPFASNVTNPTTTPALALTAKGTYNGMGTVTGSPVFNFNNGLVQAFTLGGSITPTFTNMLDGFLHTLLITQDGTGGRTITWPGNVTWPGGVSPVLNATAGAVTRLDFVWSGTALVGLVPGPNPTTQAFNNLQPPTGITSINFPFSVLTEIDASVSGTFPLLTDFWTIRDAGNTDGTGGIMLNINTQTGSTATPFQATALGTTVGFQVSPLGISKVLGPFALAADLAPTSIGSNQNNYAPTGIDTAAVLRLTSSGAVDITGLRCTAPSGDCSTTYDGRVVAVHNIGANTITLKHQNASSTANNRFVFVGAADVALAGDQSITLIYDSVTLRWRALTSPGSGGGGSSAFSALTTSTNTTAAMTVGTGASLTTSGSGTVNANLYKGNATVAVADGGTGITSGTSGGVPYYSGSTTIASSAALAANGVVLGGGASAAPTATAAGTANQVLRIPGGGGGAPAFGAIDLSAAAATTGNLAALKVTDTAYVDDGNCGSSKTIDFSTGRKHKVTLNSATCAITLSNLPNGCIGCSVRYIQDGTGGRLITYSTTVKWAGGTQPSLTATASKFDMHSFDYDGTDIAGIWTNNF